MKFTKVHGLGNDFILLDCRDQATAAPSGLARRLCDRPIGVGGDGLILLFERDGRLRMDIYNADGSNPGMCGNGIRCFGKYAYARGIVRATDFPVDTPSGTVGVHLVLEQGRVRLVQIDMGVPDFQRASLPMLGEGVCIGETLPLLDRAFPFGALRMGVSHAILLCPDAEQIDVERYGTALQSMDLFPEGVNVNFVHPKNGSAFSIRTYERGAGATLACGTGACAAAAYLSRIGLAARNAIAHLPLGELELSWDPQDHMWMAGPAELVFEGAI